MMTIPIYFFLLIEMIVVSVLDLKYRKIRNAWIVLNFVIATILFITLPEIYIFSLETFKYSIVFIMVGFLLFMLKIMGGGDSKYLASIFLLIPLGVQDKFFLTLLVFTIIIGSVVFITNIIRNFSGIVEAFKMSDINKVKTYFGKKFPYAPVILLAWMWMGWIIFLKK